MSIFETTALVRVSAHVYTQVCFVNLELNWARHFSVQFKLGLSGSAAVPLPRVPPFLFYIMSLFCVYIFHAESLVCTFAPRCLRNMPADKVPALRHGLRRRGAVPKAATGAERGRRA